MILSLLIAASTLAFASQSPIHLSPNEAQAIGLKIWQNEAGGKVQFLTHWNIGEEFGSFGIGHFIWYPKDKKGPFTESFPEVIDALVRAGENVPSWLLGHPPCPWPDRESFYADFNGPRLTELRELLARTIHLQALETARRLENAHPKILAVAPEAERASLTDKFMRIAAVPNGVYALVDYVNFKGEGINPQEAYAGQGWGLLQALQLMDNAGSGQQAVAAFVQGADAALTRRTVNAPAERQEREKKWLSGWRTRLHTYLIPLTETPPPSISAKK
jgi:hypothetical protein